MDDLLARFLPQFVTLAKTRITVAITGVGQRDAASVQKTVRELHTLAGEAGLLGLSQVVPLARDCEQKAKNLHSSPTSTDVDVLVAALHELEQLIEGISQRMGGANTS
ncbi:MAG TPA: Hpt domain-containing protein [Kofleriaceae bacterium]|jgi:HPt (histidine-containing phosphotransfer) domain-containing protein|nr:Hpt domain-containing protein [Kofleriaceae bacterium]